MSEIQRFRINKRFSEAVVYNGIVYISGQIDPKEARTVRAQTANMLDLVDEILAEVGSDKDHLLEATVYLPSLGDLSDFDKVWEEWLNPGKAPSRSVVQCQLPNPASRVKISLVAIQK